MSKALIAGINQVAADKGLDREIIFEAIEAALISAYKRKHGSVANVSAEIDRVTGDMRVLTEREVVEEIFNARTEITLEEARRVTAETKLGDVIAVETKLDDLGRIAAQTAKQVVLQRIREAERDTVYENFAHRVGEVINAQVRSVDANSGAVTILLDDKHESLLMREEQIPTERLRRGDYVRVYVVDVHKSSRGPVIKLSRTHRNLLRRLMEQEIPEVREGIVEIKAIAREPGQRSKAAVVATQPNVDAVGSCVGMRGLRIQNIVNELSGEKIDVIEWHPDLASYISNALSPAKVSNVILDEKSPIKTAIVVVPDRQLSLAIGKEGQNARLAAKLTGWRIDIKSESEAMEEGLDRLSQVQAQVAGLMPALSEDLLAVAERFLRDEERPPLPSDDLLSRAARIIEELPSEAPEVGEGMRLDLPSFEDVLSQAQVESPVRPAIPMPELPDLATLPELPRLPDEAETSKVEAEPEQPELVQEAGEELLQAEELPQVITADLLRARMAQRKKEEFGDTFEVPAELLVGLEEDEEELEEEGEEWGSRDKGKAKDRRKAVPKPEPKKAKKKKRRPAFSDDDSDQFFR